MSSKMRQQAQDFDVQIRFQHPFPFLKLMHTLHQKGRQQLWTDRNCLPIQMWISRIRNSLTKRKSRKKRQCNGYSIEMHAMCLCSRTPHFGCRKSGVDEIMHSNDCRVQKQIIKYAQGNAYWIPLMEVCGVCEHNVHCQLKQMIKTGEKKTDNDWFYFILNTIPCPVRFVHLSNFN